MHSNASRSRKRRLLFAAAIIAACSDPLAPSIPVESEDRLNNVNPVANIAAIAGTYRFTLCHPNCRTGAHVGEGILVIASDSLSLPFSSTAVQHILRRSAFIVWRGHRSANACFRVSARRSIGGREYYPGIIPEALTAVTQSANGLVVIPLYGSPDASFHAEVTFDGAGNFNGVGIQGDWDGRGPPRFGTIEGHHIDEPKVGACFPGI